MESGEWKMEFGFIKFKGWLHGRSEGFEVSDLLIENGGAKMGEGINKKNQCKREDEIKGNILEMVRKAKEGDELAIQALIEQYKPFIVKTCSKYSIPSYEFEDLIQYSYLSVLKAIRLYKFGKVHFTSYVMTAINNNLGDLLRKSIKIYREMQEEEGFNFDYADEFFKVEDELLEKESMEELEKALSTLDNEEREIISEFYEKKMPMLAIAEAHGYTTAGIGKKKKRILKKIKKEIENKFTS